MRKLLIAHRTGNLLSLKMSTEYEADNRIMDAFSDEYDFRITDVVKVITIEEPSTYLIFQKISFDIYIM